MFILTQISQRREGSGPFHSTFWLKAYGWKPSRVSNTTALSCTDGPLHFRVHLFVSFLRYDQLPPLFVRVASYWSEGFNTVAFLLPPFPFDLHSRKRSLYFDFYIRYLIQLLFCFALLIFSLHHLAWPPCCVLTFPFHTRYSLYLHSALCPDLCLWFGVLSILTLSFCVFAVKICLTTV